MTEIVAFQTQRVLLIRQLKRSHIQTPARCMSLHRFSSCEARSLPGLIRLGIKYWRWHHVGPKGEISKACHVWDLSFFLQNCWYSVSFLKSSLSIWSHNKKYLLPDFCFFDIRENLGHRSLCVLLQGSQGLRVSNILLVHPTSDVCFEGDCHIYKYLFKLSVSQLLGGVL